jgi:hypothetical protein
LCNFFFSFEGRLFLNVNFTLFDSERTLFRDSDEEDDENAEPEFHGFTGDLADLEMDDEKYVAVLPSFVLYAVRSQYALATNLFEALYMSLTLVLAMTRTNRH